MQSWTDVLQPWYPPVPRDDDCVGWAALQQRVSEVQMHLALQRRFGNAWRLPNRWRIGERLYRYGLPVN